MPPGHGVLRIFGLHAILGRILVVFDAFGKHFRPCVTLLLQRGLRDDLALPLIRASAKSDGIQNGRVQLRQKAETLEIARRHHQGCADLRVCIAKLLAQAGDAVPLFRLRHVETHEVLTDGGQGIKVFALVSDINVDLGQTGIDGAFCPTVACHDHQAAVFQFPDGRGMEDANRLDVERELAQFFKASDGRARIVRVGHKGFRINAAKLGHGTLFL